MKLAVYHDGQFWVGIVEVQEEGRLKAGRYIFGSEPKDADILQFIERRLAALIAQLSQECTAQEKEKRALNPKRLARQVAKEMRNKGASSAAQEAIKLENEKRKKEKKIVSRQQREELKERKRQIKRQKAKEKHRGR